MVRGKHTPCIFLDYEEIVFASHGLLKVSALLPSLQREGTANNPGPLAPLHLQDSFESGGRPKLGPGSAGREQGSKRYRQTRASCAQTQRTGPQMNAFEDCSGFSCWFKTTWWSPCSGCRLLTGHEIAAPAGYGGKVRAHAGGC